LRWPELIAEPERRHVGATVIRPDGSGHADDGPWLDVTGAFG
jgi:hypothetical protein